MTRENARKRAAELLGASPQAEAQWQSLLHRARQGSRADRESVLEALRPVIAGEMQALSERFGPVFADELEAAARDAVYGLIHSDFSGSFCEFTSEAKLLIRREMESTPPM